MFVCVGGGVGVEGGNGARWVLRHGGAFGVVPLDVTLLRSLNM